MYTPDFIGARVSPPRSSGYEYPEPVGCFDPRNPLMIVPGATDRHALALLRRTSICTFGPQGDPYTWFTRANIGATGATSSSARATPPSSSLRQRDARAHPDPG